MPPQTPETLKPHHIQWLWAALGLVVVILAAYLLIGGAPGATAPGQQVSTSTQSAATSTTGATQTSAGNGTATPSYKTHLYSDTVNHFSYTYPYAFTVVPTATSQSFNWSYDAGTITGNLYSAVVVPQNFETGTNFGDARFTVGASSAPGALAFCSTAQQYESAKGAVTLHGITFEKYTFVSNAAGSTFNTTSYRTVHGGMCWAIEYTIRSSSIGNFPPSEHIVAFTMSKVETPLLNMVASFKFLQ